MQGVELVVALEKELGGDIDESRLSEIYTVRELVDEVRESAARGSAPASAIRFAGWNAVLSEESTDPDVLSLSKSRPISAATLYLLFLVITLFARDRVELLVPGMDRRPRRHTMI